MTAPSRLRRLLPALVLAAAPLAAPSLAHAGPPASFGTLDIRGTRSPGTGATEAADLAAPSPPDADTLAALPRRAREAWQERARAGVERAGIERAIRERGLTTTTQGPTHRAVIERERAAQARLLRTLERMGAALTPGGWLLLAELRRAEGFGLRARGDGDPAPSFAAARTAYAQAAATGGSTPPGLWARLRESTLAAELGDAASARSGLAVVVANAPVGPVRAAALAEQAALSSGATAARLYARALAEGADAPLRAQIRVASFVAERFSDPAGARATGLAILAEPDDTAAALAAPLVGELLVRTGDPAGASLPAEIPAERAARVLAAAAEAAVAAGESAWADAAWKAITERAPGTPAATEAAGRRAALAAQPAGRPESVAQWLTRQATRCHGDALSASDQPVTGELDVMVRRLRGTARIVARARPGASSGTARFKRCLEGPLPDVPSLDSSTLHHGAVRLR